MSRRGCLSEMPPGKCMQCGDPTGGVSGAWRNWLWLEMASPNPGDPKTLVSLVEMLLFLGKQESSFMYQHSYL